MKRQITLEEWKEYEWIDVGGGTFVRGLKVTSPPHMPDDGLKYTLREITVYSDTERKWEWVPAMVEE